MHTPSGNFKVIIDIGGDSLGHGCLPLLPIPTKRRRITVSDQPRDQRLRYERMVITTSMSEDPRLARRYTKLGLWVESEWLTPENSELLPSYSNGVRDMHRAHLYTESIVNRVLIELARENKGENVKKQYYEILLGPWLRSFAAVIFDRISNLKFAATQYPNVPFLVASYPTKTNRICEDSSHYYRCIKTDKYNNQIFEDLLVELKIPYLSNNVSVDEDTLPSRHRMGGLLCVMTRFINRINHLIRPKNRFLYYRPCIGRWDSMVSQLLLGQLPTFHRENTLVPLNANDSSRINLDISRMAENEFERIFLRMLGKYLPKTLRHHSRHYINQFYNRALPNKLGLILTSSSLEYDDLFKHFAAHQSSGGASLVIQQHGGLYGQGLFVVNEENDIGAADIFLSWGWREKKGSRLGLDLSPSGRPEEVRAEPCS